MDKLLRALPKHKSNDTYYWNINFTPHSLKLHDNGKLENIDGNYAYEITEEDMGIDNLNTHHIIAHGDDIYIVGFYTRVLYSIDVFGVLKYELDTEAKEASLYEIVYTEDSNILGFTYSSILDLEETNGLIKVYINLSEQSNNRISDGNTVYINIDTTIPDNSSIIKESVLKKGLNSITVSQENGGSLAVGDYRYAFRLIKKNGVVTKWSPISNNKIISKKYNDYYTGSLISKVQDDGESYQEQINSESSAEITFDIDSIHRIQFDYIEILRIYTYDPDMEPIFEICKLIKIGDSSEYTIRDTTNNDVLDTLSMADFLIGSSQHAAGISAIFKNRKFNANILDQTVDTSKPVSGEPTLNGEPFWEGALWNYVDTSDDVIVELNGIGYYTNPADFPTLRRISDDVNVEYDPTTMDSISASQIKMGLATGSSALYRANIDGDWGLEGPNIRIIFVHTENRDGDDNIVTHNLVTTKCSDPEFDIVHTVQHNSIYRVALRFFDMYGNKYLRYVGDVITPPYDYNDTLYVVEHSKVSLRTLQMGINVIDPPSTFKSVQILAVNRTKEDRLVLGLGLGITHTTTKRDDYTNNIYDRRLLLDEHYPNPGGSSMLVSPLPGTWSIFNPEHLLGNVDFKDEKLEYRKIHETSLYNPPVMHSELTVPEKEQMGDYVIYTIFPHLTPGDGDVTIPTKHNSSYYKSTNSTDEWSRAITQEVISEFDEDTKIPMTDSDVEYKDSADATVQNKKALEYLDTADWNRDKSEDFADIISLCSNSLAAPLFLLYGETFSTPELAAGLSKAKDNIYIFEIANPRLVYPFGGTSRKAIKNSEFIPVSPVETISLSTFPDGSGRMYSQHSYKGDCFNGFMIAQIRFQARADKAFGNAYFLKSSYVVFPIESSVNLHQRGDGIRESIFEKNKDLSVIAATNNNGMIGPTVHTSAGSSQYPNKIKIDKPDLYSYNNIFNKTFDIEKIKSVSDIVDKSTVFPNMIRWSERKYYGEFKDNWTIFKSNNFSEINPQFGAATNLIEFKERLVLFQEKALSILHIQETSQTLDMSEEAIALGTGDILGSQGGKTATVIAENVGCVYNANIVKSKSAIYWIDNRSGHLYMWQGDRKPPQALSLIKGIPDIFQDAININTKLFGHYFERTGEVYLTIINEDSQYDAHDPMRYDDAYYSVYDISSDPVHGDRVTLVGDGDNLDIKEGDIVFLSHEYPNHTFRYDGQPLGPGALEFILIEGDIEEFAAKDDLISLLWHKTKLQSFTVIYNEMRQEFTHIATFLPKTFIYTKNKYFTIPVQAPTETEQGQVLYEHFVDKSKLFDKLLPSKLQFSKYVQKPTPWKVLEVITEFTKDNNLINWEGDYNKTISYIKISNATDSSHMYLLIPKGNEYKEDNTEDLKYDPAINKSIPTPLEGNLQPPSYSFNIERDGETWKIVLPQIPKTILEETTPINPLSHDYDGSTIYTHLYGTYIDISLYFLPENEEETLKIVKL